MWYCATWPFFPTRIQSWGKPFRLDNKSSKIPRTMKLAAMYGWWLLGLVAGHTSRESNKTASLESEPNPIALQYPNSGQLLLSKGFHVEIELRECLIRRWHRTEVTGTINGTMVVVPIPYSLARSIIPAQWGIITAAYESLLPDFPKNHYPVRSSWSYSPLQIPGLINTSWSSEGASTTIF